MTTPCSFIEHASIFIAVENDCGVHLEQVDINGDGMMEWDEFTRFVVVKAQLHHAQMSIDQLAEYRQGPRQARDGGWSLALGAT